MWTTGVIGLEADTIASRLDRHFHKSKILSAGTRGLQPGVLYCIDQSKKLNRAERPRMVLLVVDPPPPDSPNFLPIANFLRHHEDCHWIPFWLSEKPGHLHAGIPHMSTRSSFREAVEVFMEVTNELWQADETVLDDPVMTREVIKVLAEAESFPVAFRVGKTDAEKEAAGLGTGTVIGVTAVKGGSGKSTFSTVSSNMTTEWALDRGKSTLFIETNIGQPTVMESLWQRPTGGKDILWAQTQLETGRNPIEVVEEAVADLMPVVTGSTRFKGIVTSLRQGGGDVTVKPHLLYALACGAASIYDYVIIDTPPIDRTDRQFSDEFLLPASDHVIALTDCDYQSSANTFSHFAHLTLPAADAVFPRDKLWVVLNREGEHPKFDLSDLKTLAETMEGEGEPWQIAGSIPYSMELKSFVNEGARQVPSVASVDRAIAGILETVLGLDSMTILPDKKPVWKKKWGKRKR